MASIQAPSAFLIVLALGGFCIAPAHAGTPITVETVPVGNPGNAGEQSRIQNSDPTFYGGVAYEFTIGKFEVTAAQYTAFLNAVGATDTYGLYHVRMDYDADTTRAGCNIKRHGAAGSYTYSVAPEWANRPVNYVSWADAVRFANWLHNGQPNGAQDTTTTEDGSYRINRIGEGNDTALENVVREPDAPWVIPTENEWYKAAYHKNDGATTNYWNYPTQADVGLSMELIDPDPGNNATCSGGTFGDWTIGAPYFRTEAGTHENSESPYGTFDQAGNVMEFTERVPESDIRRIRGSSWQSACINAFVSEVDDVMHSSDQFRDLGFRVANLDMGTVSVPGGGAGVRLRFAISGAQPVVNEAWFTVELPEAAQVRIEVFDVTGRRLPGGIDRLLPAGASEVRWNAAGWSPGVYLARLQALGRSEVVRFVRVR